MQRMLSVHNCMKLKIAKKEIWRIQKYVEIKNHFQITNGSKKKSQRKLENTLKEN